MTGKGKIVAVSGKPQVSSPRAPKAKKKIESLEKLKERYPQGRPRQLSNRSSKNKLNF